MFQRQGEMGVLLLMKVTFGLQPRVGTGCQKDCVSRLQLSVAPSPTRRRSWRMNQPMANDLVNLDYVMKPS